MHKLIAVCLVVVSLVLISTPLGAVSKGELIGFPGQISVFFGPGGLPNIVDIEVDTLDGIKWIARCRRASGNLGLCSDIHMSAYTFGGEFSSNTVLELTYSSQITATPSLKREKP